jgi:hypothetical protein
MSFRSIRPTLTARRSAGAAWVWVGSLLVAAALLAQGGCEIHDEVQHYQALKPQTFRMLAVIIPHESQFWVFKVSGTVDQMKELKPEVDAFLDSVRFAGNQPKWKVPATWRQGETDALRQAAFLLGPVEEPLEMTVSALPKPEKDADEFLMLNVNRWRGQMGLRSLDPAEPLDAALLMAALSKKETNGVIVRYTADLVGPKPGKTRRGPMMAGMAPPAVPDRPPPPPEQDAGELRYDAPAGWQELPAPRGGERKAAFRIAGGAEVTVLALPPQVGARLLDNVNRWRAQIRQPDITEDQLSRVVKSIPIDGTDASYVILPGDKPNATGILAVLALRPDHTWSFKLMGPTSVLEREKSNFEAFLRSVRLP